MTIKLFSVTGPYGSGKSSFAVFLSALFEPRRSTAHVAALDLLRAESGALAQSFEVMRKRLGIDECGFVVLKVTARRDPLLCILRDALASALDQLTEFEPLRTTLSKLLSEDQLVEQDIVKAFKAIQVERPVLLCLDEFGKSLEWFSEHRSYEGDIYVLQQLIEQGQTSNGNPLVLITFQHLAFDDYAADAAALRQREWAKIQGRFRDFPFSDSSQTTGFLMTRCLQRLRVEQPANANEVWREFKSVSIADKLNLNFESLAPLHPLTAVLLPELCSKYGQHERSLFKFLSSSDERSLHWLVQSNLLVDGWVMPWHLYDYFLSTAGSTSALPSLAQRWIEIQTRLRDAVGLTEFELEILKTIGIFNLCSSSGCVSANQNLLRWVLESRAPEQYSLEAALEQLSSIGFITYRGQADEFRIWRGSDFDLGEQVRLLMASYRHEPLDQLLACTIALEPLIATRHSQQSCVVRLFQQCFASTRSDLTTLEPLFKDPDGLLVWWLSDSSPEELSLPTWAHTVVLVEIDRPSDLRQLATYVQAYQTLLQSKVIPEQDWVARREAQERLAASLQRLQERVLPLLQVSESSKAQILKPLSFAAHTSGHRSSAALLSAVCDKIYEMTPRVPNEMISRRELTSQGAKARRILIEAISEHSDEECCGLLRGFGPERAMFDALIGSHGLHQNGIGLQWPFESSQIYPAYVCIDTFFIGAEHKKRSLFELWSQLKAPPFGLKDGPIPVLLAHYLLLHDDQVGLYEDGRFVPGVDSALIERLTRSPQTFHCSSFALDGLRKTFVHQLLDALDIQSPQTITLLYAVKQLLRQVRHWPSYARHTQSISSHARAVRKACLGAKEPDQLMFVELPKAVGLDISSNDSITKAVRLIATAILEVGSCFDVLLIAMQEAVGEALNCTGSSIRNDLSSRAVRLKDQILDPKLRAFALALADQELKEDRDWLQRLGLALLGRAPSEWIGNDVKRFHIALDELAPAFRRIEALHFNHHGDGQSGFKAVRLGVTTSDGDDHQQVITLPDSQISHLETFVKRMLAEAKQTFGDNGAEMVLAHWAQQSFRCSTGGGTNISLVGNEDPQQDSMTYG